VNQRKFTQLNAEGKQAPKKKKERDRRISGKLNPQGNKKKKKGIKKINRTDKKAEARKTASTSTPA